MVQLVYQIGVLLLIHSPIWGTTFLGFSSHDDLCDTNLLSISGCFVISIWVPDWWSLIYTQLIFQIRFIVSTQFGDEIRMDDRAWIPNLGKAYNTAAEYIYILETTPPFYNAVTKRKRTLIQSDVVLSFTMSCSGLSFCASCTTCCLSQRCNLQLKTIIACSKSTGARFSPVMHANPYGRLDARPNFSFIRCIQWQWRHKSNSTPLAISWTEIIAG